VVFTTNLVIKSIKLLKIEQKKYDFEIVVKKSLNFYYFFVFLYDH